MTDSLKRLQALQDRESPASHPPGNQLPRAQDLRALLSQDFPPRRWLAKGFLQEKDAGMVHAYRGVGKSRFVHGLAVAVAAGGEFLRYQCDEPRGVLLVDGELPREQLQRMLTEQLVAATKEPTAPFSVLATDLLEDPLPCLSTRKGQEAVEANLEGVALVILDNVSTLCGNSRAENEAESWGPIQEWLLRLRRMGLAVLLVHHDGKGGQQRGTSKREDILSQVVQLTRPADYEPSAGARFEVHLVKGRGVLGAEANPFEAQMQVDEAGRPTWTWRPLKGRIDGQILRLHQDGLKQREIAKRLGVGVATVNRRLKKLKQEGEMG